MEPALLQGRWELELSKKESIEIADSKRLLSGEQIHHVLYVKGDLDSERDVEFAKEVFVNGNASIGEKNILRAITCIGDIFLSRAASIRRWIRSEGNIETQEGCDLGISASCSGEFNIAKKCKFRSLYGNPINIFSNITMREANDFGAARHINKKNKIENDSWLIVKKHISINQGQENKGENIVRGKSNLSAKRKINEEQKWFIISKYISIPPFTLVDRNFVVRKSLIVSNNCTILGSIKAYEEVFIQSNVSIYGNIFAEGNISIGNNCVLWGNIFSQGLIRISSGTTIGKSRDIKSVIGKRGIELSGNITIHGYALTEGSGNII
jgi:cytoskeletal protein CcmA (bactofilin family)